MPPCPVPLDVWKLKQWNSLRRNGPNSGSILARPVGFATFNSHADQLYNARSTGSDIIPRRYCKYGPPVFR